MPIPNKGLLDPDKIEDATDSVVSAIDRHMQMEAAAAERAKQVQAEEARRQQRQETAAKEARQDEDAFIERVTKLSDPISRDALLQRIRDMRNETGEKPYKPPPVHPNIMAQTEREQEQGRIAQQQAQARYDAQQALRIAQQKEDAEKQGSMTPVAHPNPTQNEQFPASKATLGKTK
jgi:hypothetical protein